MLDEAKTSFLKEVGKSTKSKVKILDDGHELELDFGDEDVYYLRMTNFSLSQVVFGLLGGGSSFEADKGFPVYRVTPDMVASWVRDAVQSNKTSGK